MPCPQGYLTLCPLTLKPMPAQVQDNLTCTALKCLERAVLSGWLRDEKMEETSVREFLSSSGSAMETEETMTLSEEIRGAMPWVTQASSLQSEEREPQPFLSSPTQRGYSEWLEAQGSPTPPLHELCVLLQVTSPLWASGASIFNEGTHTS